MTEDQKRFSSWKEISEYLACSEKTARRWEKSRGLPIRRLPGGTKSSVFAYHEEIKAWLDTNNPTVLEPVHHPISLLPQVLIAPTRSAATIRVSRLLPIVILLAIAIVALLVRGGPENITVRLTGNPERLSLSTAAKQPPIMTDGKQVYFQEFDHGRFRIMQAPLAAATLSGPLDISLSNPDLGVLSEDGSTMLLRNVEGSKNGDEPLYVQPLQGVPRRLGNITAYDSAWTPDRKQVVFGKSRSIYVATADGADVRKLFDVPGRAYHFRWSPSGLLRFTVYDSKRSHYQIWETPSLDASPKPISFNQGHVTQQCCGEWTKDGSLFVFQALIDGFYQILVHSERTRFFHSGSDVTAQLTFGPMNFRSPLPTPRGDRLLVLSQLQKSEIVRYDEGTEHWMPLFEGIPAATVAFSKDGKWAAYTRMPDHTLWRCQMPHCQNATQLTFTPVRATMPQWSPDATQIACMTRTLGNPWRASLVSANGGPPSLLIDEGDSTADADPTWSPTGDEIAFASIPSPDNVVNQSIRVLNLKTRITRVLQGSAGFQTPHWSPDGRFLAAVRADSRELGLYEFATERWSRIAGTRAGYLNWSAKGNQLYFLSPAGKDPAKVMTLDVSDLRPRLAAALSNIRQPTFSFGDWVGLGPSDTLLALRDLSTDEILSWHFEH